MKDSFLRCIGPISRAACLFALPLGAADAAQLILPGPTGSTRFGTFVAVLPSGDFVVADPNALGANGASAAGAVHHFRPDGTRVATLRGDTSNDQVGSFGIIVLASGNYLVRSPGWDSDSAVNAGAVTFVRGDTGLDGVVSPANSLVGSSIDDRLGFRNIFALPNGNYVVTASDWDNGNQGNAGAVVFGRGDTGVVGTISAANALIGSTLNDRVGFFGIVTLANGNWLSPNPDLDVGGLADAGAVTFGSATTGRFGVISAANSLVGTSAGDRVGSDEVGILTNGNYVVTVPEWDNGTTVDAGAAVFGNGNSGTAGLVGPDKALVGTTAGDRVGSDGITVLPGGRYLVVSPEWRNGANLNAGAVTFGGAASGVVGAVSTANSAVGTRTNDRVGSPPPLVLANGNWVIGAPFWDNGATTDVGAVAFGSGTTGRTGAIATNNALIGTTAFDRVGDRLVALQGTTAQTQGGYVILSPQWNGNGGSDVGAVTVLSGTGGVNGNVTTGNSLVGAQSGDFIGSGGGFALPDGRFVISSPNWNNGAELDAGAVTLRESTPLVSGVVGAANSLIGARAGDEVGGGGVAVLPNSAFLVLSPKFSPGAATQAGAVTWMPAGIGRITTVSGANSLVGSSLLDNVGGDGASNVHILDDGDVVLASPFWDDGAIDDVGAATYIDRDSGIFGAINSFNSLIGSSSGDAVGFNGVEALPGGDYLVRSVSWRNGAAANAGAVTLGTDSGTSGVVSPANSIVGSSVNDLVGSEVTVFPNGHYIARTRDWDNGSTTDVGAFTMGLPNGVVSGALTSEHSVLGTVANGGAPSVVGYDPVRNQMVVGQPLANRVVLHRSGAGTSCGIATPAINPSSVGEPVTFDITVSANASAGNPDNGQVTIRAANGQQCVDTTGTPIVTGLVRFSCAIAFNQFGDIGVFAEYTGSTAFAFCRTPTITQTVVPLIFRNSFE